MRTDDYSDEEMKIMFNWILLGQQAGFARGFMVPILKVSLDEIDETKEKFDEKFAEKEELNQDEIDEFLRTYSEYPAFDEYMTALATREIEDALDDVIMESKISFKLPFYVEYAFFLKFSAATMNMLGDFVKNRHMKKALLSNRFDFLNQISEEIDELLGEKIIIEKLYDCILKTLVEAKQNTDDEILNVKITKLLDLLSMIGPETHFVFKDIFIKSLLQNFGEPPQPPEDSGITVGSTEDMLNSEILEQYLSYLESKGLKREADFLKELNNETKKETIWDIVNTILKQERSF